MSSTLTNFLAHIVFSTKKREPLISQELANELYPYIGGIIQSKKGKLITIGGTENHVHILGVFSPTIAISEMLQHIKGGSSKWINAEKRPRFRFAWQRGYAGFAVSESLCDRVTQYIKNQQAHHKKMTFKEEYVNLLKKHHIPYEEQYIWD